MCETRDGSASNCPSKKGGNLDGENAVCKKCASGNNLQIREIEQAPEGCPMKSELEANELRMADVVLLQSKKLEGIAPEVFSVIHDLMEGMRIMPELPTGASERAESLHFDLGTPKRVVIVKGMEKTEDELTELNSQTETGGKTNEGIALATWWMLLLALATLVMGFISGIAALIGVGVSVVVNWDVIVGGGKVGGAVAPLIFCDPIHSSIGTGNAEPRNRMGIQLFQKNVFELL